MIVNYTHAKWLSYKYDIPLLFKPFQYSEQFEFHVKEKHFSRLDSYYTIHELRQLLDLQIAINKPTLFLVKHSPDSYEEHLAVNWGNPYVPVNWKDPGFKKLMCELIKPRFDLNLIYPPENVISVALHYRSGVGFDCELARRYHPLRFLLDEYYIEQLTTLHKLVNHEPMYVYIFTDHPDPRAVVNLFKPYFPDNIEFDCRKIENRHDLNVVEDLFSMTKFDCMIRPVSHYSIIASHIADFKIEIYPAHKTGDIVDRVSIISNSTWNPITKKWEALDQEIVHH